MFEVLTKDSCLLELPELQYDKNELLKIYNEVKDYARVKYLPWKEVPSTFTKPEDSKSLIIQSHDYQIKNPDDHNKGINLLEFDYIRNLAERFNFNHKIYPQNIMILVYKEGYVFKPHVDGYAASVVMFPIITTSPIDFYYDNSVEFELSKEYELGYDNICYTHHYSDKYATIINSHAIHGVRPTTGLQVKLKFNINESFHSIKQKYLNERLIR